jgi:hypothetical protein
LAFKTILATPTVLLSESQRTTFWQATEGDWSASNVGAVAQLFDISCLDGTAEFSTIQCASLGAWNALTNTDPLDGALAQAMKTELNLTVTGQHFFQKSSGPPVPVWDLRADPPFQNNPNAFVVAKKVNSVPSPDGTSDVAWLELAKVSGELANTIYRINTEGGQPAASVSSLSTGVYPVRSM